MGNSLSSEEKAMELEKKILMKSGLDVDKDLFISNIVIDYRGKNFIHTIKCGEDSNPNVIVMLHGYGGTGLFYYKLFKELSQHYKVYTIDHLGMGLSSRPDFDCENLEQTTDFFVDSLEAWRQSVGLESFILCGHSFGGYIAASYTKKYLKVVKGLILLSPLGFTKENTEWAYLEDDDYRKDMKFWDKFILKKRLAFFKEKQTPSELASSNWAWIFKLFIKRFWIKRLKLNKDVADEVWEYINEIFKIPNSSERCLHFIVNPNIIAYHPIEDMINELNLPMTVLYGDQDWMSSRGAKRVHSNNLHSNFIFAKVKDCGHQMVMENHLGLLEYFINKIEIVNTSDLEKLSI